MGTGLLRVSGQVGSRSPGVSARVVLWGNSERATERTIVEVFKQHSAANDGAARLSAGTALESGRLRGQLNDGASCPLREAAARANKISQNFKNRLPIPPLSDLRGARSLAVKAL